MNFNFIRGMSEAQLDVDKMVAGTSEAPQRIKWFRAPIFSKGDLVLNPFGVNALCLFCYCIPFLVWKRCRPSSLRLNGWVARLLQIKAWRECFVPVQHSLKNAYDRDLLNFLELQFKSAHDHDLRNFFEFAIHVKTCSLIHPGQNLGVWMASQVLDMRLR